MFIGLVIIMSLLVEAVIEYGKLIAEKKFKWENGVATVLGGFFVWFAGIDIFAYMGLEPVVSEAVVFWTNLVIMSVIFGRFAGNLNSLWEWLKGLKNSGPELGELVTMIGEVDA